MKAILSIDGGGIRGIIPALILQEIEARSGMRIADLFDLIVGTSTGGIIAITSVVDHGDGTPEFTAEDLVKLYEINGKKIFSRSFLKYASSVMGAADEKYSSENIESVLKDYFADDRMGSALVPVMVTTYDIHNREPFFIKSWKDDTMGIRMRDAARATSAAPTYFEPLLLGDRALIDGGIYINNPTVSAFAEAIRIFSPEEQFLVVSLGTGELTRRIEYDRAKNWGAVEWLIPLLDSVFDGASDVVNYQLKQFIPESFYRIQTTLNYASDDMDDATPENIEKLKFEARTLINRKSRTIDRIVHSLGKR